MSQPKEFHFKPLNVGRWIVWSLFAVILFVVLLALLSYQPAVVLFGGFVAYFLSGFVMSGWAMSRKRRTPAAPS